ncbi:MAG: ATP-dependent zinc metalloprotease FtsH [Firmicutes bacterium]|nr:ATP-dependent zinc metalloprotease FtsH [Bacillota bacterium]
MFFLVVMLIMFFYTLTGQNQQTVEEYNYNEFMQQVEQGNVASVVIAGEQNRYIISGELKDETKFSVITFPDAALGEILLAAGVEVEYDKVPGASWWMTLLSTIIPFVLMIGLFFLLMNQAQGGGKMAQFGKSRAKLNMDERSKVTFADVAGVDEVKEELEEVVDFLKDPRKFNALGAHIPKGVLLYGPPGTGKTLLARAVAGEAGVPFFSISGSDFVEMFVGVGASRVRDLFTEAKKHAPCIVFIDEIDAVGRQRGAGLGGGHDEREQTLNQLLVEMDGFAPNVGIIVIAATNRPDILDPALLRPGRFDRQITVDAPDILGREQILEVHAKNKPLSEDVDLKVVARRTPGFTGADLANVVNEAALLAARNNRNLITMEDFEYAAERVIAGPEKKSAVINDKEKKLVSYHEAGHAVVAYYLEHSDPVHKVSIIPRGRAGGYTLLLPEEDKKYVTKGQMLDDLCMFLGGRVAEELILKDVSTGAQNDLERATETVRNMITRYGMSDELGLLTFGRQTEQVFLGRDISHERNYSEAIAYAIDKEARAIMDAAHNKTVAILTEHIDRLHLVAQHLMQYETLEGADFKTLMETGEPLPIKNEFAEEGEIGFIGNEFAENEFVAEADEQPNLFKVPDMNISFTEGIAGARLKSDEKNNDEE